jgi:hypothetical protein
VYLATQPKSAERLRPKSRTAVNADLQESREAVNAFRTEHKRLLKHL